MANATSERRRAESFLFDTSRLVTGPVAATLMPLSTTGRHPAMERIVEAFRDPSPDESLSGSASHPFAFWQNPFSNAPLPPQEKWNRIRRVSAAWPEPMRRRAAALLGKSGLPTWTRIENHLSRLGFEAVPVKSRVDEPTYSYLVATARFPVHTRFALHYRRAPHYAVMLDTFHDLGHAIAITMDDYRKLYVAFARALLGCSGKVATGQKISDFYSRHFEYAYVHHSDGTAEPVGAVPIAFQTVEFRRGRLWPIAAEPRKLLPLLRPFSSRAEWARLTAARIEKLRHGRAKP